MRFPNAFAGVKKLFAAAILEVIAAGCTLIAAFFIGTASASVVEGSGAGALASLGGMAIFGIAAGVLAIIAFIFQLIGVNKAKLDEPSFNTALIFIIVGIIASAVSTFTSGALKTIVGVVNTVAGILVTYFIIVGIMKLGEAYGDQAIVGKGKTLIGLIICIQVLSMIATILGSFAFTGVLATVFSVIAAIASIVQTIIFITYLSNAKKMLAA